MKVDVSVANCRPSYAQFEQIDRRHQNWRATHTEQDHRGKDHGARLGNGKQCTAPGSTHRKQADRGPAWSNPVEQYTDKQLTDGKGRKPGTQRIAEHRGAQVEFLGQLWRQHRQKGPVKVADDIGDSEYNDARHENAFCAVTASKHRSVVRCLKTGLPLLVVNGKKRWCPLPDLNRHGLPAYRF